LNKSTLLTIALVLLIAGAIIGGWVWINLPTGTNSATGEIRLYNGQKLSSINDFRPEAENGTPNIDINTYTLTITGLVQNETVLTYDDIVDNHTHYEKVATLHCVENWDVTVLWEGVSVKDLLQDAGYDQNAQILIFYCQDGYTTSLPLSYIVGNNIIIAFKVNGLKLPQSEGFPFRLVAEGKLGYKWAKWVTRIEVSNDTSFRGYWESRGFSNDANWP
jgi:DMSO/TMAO reductase YedYZ molybdopterin-dependent catalytic subunit